MQRNVLRTQYQFRCRRCCKLTSLWYEECPYCGNPLSLLAEPLARTFISSGSQTLEELTSETLQRFPTNLPGLDYVIGGGWIARSVNLVLGAPGCGKSTLMLMCACLGGEDSLYATSEEQPGPIATRAKRLGLPVTKKTRLIATKYWEAIEDEIFLHRPRVVYIDSIQDTWVRNMPDFARGGPQQQFYIADRCELIANKVGWPISFVIISHVTKDGDFKGHNDIPHKVSAVFRFKYADRIADVREFAPVKNRYGSVRQSAWFQMTDEGGLIELADRRAAARQERMQRYQPLQTDADGKIIITPPTPAPARGRRRRDDDDE